MASYFYFYPNEVCGKAARLLYFFFNPCSIAEQFHTQLTELECVFVSNYNIKYWGKSFFGQNRIWNYAKVKQTASTFNFHLHL